VAVFQNWLPVLKIYNVRYVYYRFLVLAVILEHSLLFMFVKNMSVRQKLSFGGLVSKKPEQLLANQKLAKTRAKLAEN